MIRHGHRTGDLASAALPPALALVLAALAGPAFAQETLPSVSDYHLPSAASTPRSRPQGPTDSDNPVVIAAPDGEAAPASPAPAAHPKPSAAPRARATAAPATPAVAAASASARPTVAAAKPQPTQAAHAASPVAPPLVAATAATIAAPTPEAPLPGPSAAPFEWNVHSANTAAAGQTSAIWPWLAALAFLLGAGGILLVQRLRRKRGALAADPIDWEAPAPAEVVPPVYPAIPSIDPVPALASELDLISFMAEPEAPQPPRGTGALPEAAPQPRPALNVLVNPLDVVLTARRLSATLMNAVLNYELTVSNTRREAIGPIIVGGDMIGAHASLPSRSQLELGGQSIVPLHHVATLAPGESVTLSGEFKLPLRAITPIRSGNAALFIPLARFRVEAARRGAPPLVIERTFVVGENQDIPGAALKPFRLDLGPRLYSQLGQRELALSA